MVITTKELIYKHHIKYDVFWPIVAVFYVVAELTNGFVAFNVAKIASSARSLTISLTKSLRVAGPLVVYDLVKPLNV